MEFKKFMALGIKPREGVLLTKYLIAIHKADENCVSKIVDLFKNHGYDLSLVPGSFYKILTKNANEIKDLEEVLTEIDNINVQLAEDISLKSVFASDLRYGCFTSSFISRIKSCMANNLPYLYEDNTFISELFSSKKFEAYTANIPLEEIKTEEVAPDFAPFSENVEREVPKSTNSEPMTLTDPEDLNVRTEIIYTLTKTMEANQNDPTLNFLVTNIIANLNDVIAMDNKEYRVLGTRHLVENALQGVNITPELQVELDDKVLKAFSDFSENKEGVRK